MLRTKRARGPLRTMMTKTINETEAALAVNPPDRTVLEDKLIKLDDIWEQLVEADERVYAAMLDEDEAEADLEEEKDAVQDYRDRVRRTQVAVTRVLGREATVSLRSGTPVDAASLVVEKKKNFKLPKIELKKFNGQLTDWIGFWGQFSKIHSDDELHSADKFQYLLQAMEPGSRPMEVVSSYPPSGDNYTKVVEALKERFGRDDLLVEVYVRELLRLVINNVNGSQGKPRVSGFFDRIESHLRALETLGVTSDKFASMLFPLVESSLPEETLRAWQRAPPPATDEDKRKSRLTLLMEFLRREVESEERIRLARSGFGITQVRKPQRVQPSMDEGDIPTAAGLFAGEVSKCIFCDGAHNSKDCSKAFKLSMSERKKKVESRRCCYSCLRPGHTSKKCKSFVKCPVCSRKHPIILCNELDKQNEKKSSPSGSQDSQLTGNTSGSGNNINTVMNSLTCSADVVLQTLLVRVGGPMRSAVVRALIDSGSQRSYILQSVAEDLDLHNIGQQEITHSLFGGRTIEKAAYNKYKVDMAGIRSSEKKTLSVLAQSQICGRIPRVKRNDLPYQQLKDNGIWLSDVGDGLPQIDLLLGADACGMIMTGRGHQLSDKLVAVETCLGWTIMGSLPHQHNEANYASHVVSLTILDSSWEQMWSLEALGIRDNGEAMTRQEEDKQTKEQFNRTLMKKPDGRYIVRLPWRDDSPVISSNYQVALNRLKSATRKLNNQGEYKTYEKIFLDWLKEGIIEEVNERMGTRLEHYIPHHAVFKPSSKTTPVRPVFDASCRNKNDLSLNDLLHKGPNILELIPSILNRFRERRIGFTSDIRKAFQMVELAEEDRNAVRFLWWDSYNEVKIFRHCRVVFGLNASPFLLAATIESHLSKMSGHRKTIGDMLQRSMYVDNCVASVDNLDEYEDFKTTATEMMREAQMELRLWAETTVETTGVDSPTSGECGLGVDSCHPQEEMSTGILGLLWNRTKDTLSVVVSVSNDLMEVTKRSVMSKVAKIYDPIGVTCPALLHAKMILQQSWSQKIGWDDHFPPEERDTYRKWEEGLPVLSSIEIPRWAFRSQGEIQRIDAHVFSDASSSAYAAVVFARIQGTNGVDVRLITAKNRLAPMKKLTIPRLELMGCVIAVRLYQSIIDSLDCVNFNSVCFWSDSTIALAWIKKVEPWKVFVKNRVDEIRKQSAVDNWRHIPGEFNPADLPSRGCLPKELLHSRWWEGPEWLRKPKEQWPVSHVTVDDNAVDAERSAAAKVCQVTATLTASSWYCIKFSSYISNVRVMAWINRFLRNCRKAKLGGDLTVNEINEAEVILLHAVQKEVFHEQREQKFIKGIKVCHDEEGRIRVQTKLLRREDSMEFKRPLLLPSNHAIVERLIIWEHQRLRHAGVQILMGSLRERVWILQGRRTIKKVIGKCVTCQRYTSKRVEVEPAPLPAPRVNSGNLFQTTGVDLAGPLYVKDGTKAWVVLFTCSVYRAVHLEVVNSLSTESFLLAFWKFISRRGRPAVVYSDNGTNFVGAENAFAKLDWKRIHREANCKRIQWRFNPPTAAWWGGFWERIIRCAKDLLRRMLGHRKLTYFQLESCVVEVESILNDRPLTFVSEDDDDLIPLSPSVFLREQPAEFPESDVLKASDLRAKFKSLGQLRSELRQRFRNEYLSILIHRGKPVRTASLTVGDVVLVGTDNVKRLFWPMGRVLELIPGRDGVHRVARVKTSTGVLIRPLQRLYKMELQDDDKPQAPAELTTSEDCELPASDSVKTRYGRVVRKPDYFKAT